MNVVDRARNLVIGAVERRTFPAAAVHVGASSGPLWTEAFGRLAFVPLSLSSELAPPTTLSTVFDLASLTKVIATTTVIMDLVARDIVGLDERVADSISEWRGGDREAVTVQDLLEHASGLPARLVDHPPATRRELEHDICSTPLTCAPRTRSIYSDLGFILLGLLAERRANSALDVQFSAVVSKLLPSETGLAASILTFGPSGEMKPHAAPTRPLSDDVRRGRLLQGEVHDSYAALSGGVAGHAGLFGTAAGVGAFARVVLRAARAARGDSATSGPCSDLVARFTTRSAVPGSSRALGWDTMLPTSSCGTLMSRSAIGHVGFTGTSLWIDPARDRYFVLLTNRACDGATPDELQAMRRAFHDALHEL
jgi:CubicO group peptidase (beta-lactamase class C family)